MHWDPCRYWRAPCAWRTGAPEQDCQSRQPYQGAPSPAAPSRVGSVHPASELSFAQGGFGFIRTRADAGHRPHRGCDLTIWDAKRVWRARQALTGAMCSRGAARSTEVAVERSGSPQRVPPARGAFWGGRRPGNRDINRKGGRADDCSGFEPRQAVTPPGFESQPFRHFRPGL